jgi:predicted nucleic acid-binding protein
LTLVVDASVAVKWFLVEPGRPEAMRLLDRGQSLIAPELVVAEVTNAVWKRVTSNEIELEQVVGVPGALADMFAELPPITPLAARAFEIAMDLRHPAYDCFYLALAEERDTQMVTADRRLLARLSGTSWAERAIGLGH